MNLGPLEARVVGIGLPFYWNSSHERAPAEGADRIAALIHRPESNPFTDTGVDLSAPGTFAYLGSADLDEPSFTRGIGALVRAVYESPRKALFIGGDHSITAPIVAALHERHGALHLVHIDAHPDLYEDFEGNPCSHASPFARILERGHAASLTQYGIRTLNPHQREQIVRYGVKCHEMRSRERWPRPRLEGPTYVSIDLDGLDPAFAPGVSHPEPGGLSVREVLDIVHAIEAPIVGADVVEYNLARDPSGSTALAAAKLARELLGMMLRPERTNCG
jgi:agmatinase